MKVTGDRIVIRRSTRARRPGSRAQLGALLARDSVALLDALRLAASIVLTRTVRPLSGPPNCLAFLEKNTFGRGHRAIKDRWAAMIERGRPPHRVQDSDGVAHFNAAFRKPCC